MGGQSPVIEISEVTKVYGSRKAVDGVSLEVMPGEIFGVLGPNGAGKTTLLEMTVGLRIPSSGSIRVLGLDPVRERSKLVHHIGVQPQEASLFQNLRVLEILRLFASFHAQPLPPETVLEMVGLQEKQHDLVKRLSGGQRQRLLIGVALVSNPRVLFLDEPTGSLDPHARRQLWEVILRQRAEGRTIVLTTHYMEEAETLCDRVAILHRGRVLAVDTPQNLITTHFPEKVVVCEVPQPVEPARLKALPGALDVSVVPRGTGYQVRVRTTQPDQILKELFDGNLLTRPSDLRVEQATLEDVFLRLTGEGSREPASTRRRAAGGR